MGNSTKSLFQLGMNLALDSPRKAQKEAPSHPCPDYKGHFIIQNGLVFAGRHLIVDLWDAYFLDNKQHIRKTFRKAVRESGAQLLKISLHTFTPYDGISGVALLAESHISIHTWPERNYAALDIFMCGETYPYKAVEVFKHAFATNNITLQEIQRGRVP